MAVEEGLDFVGEEGVDLGWGGADEGGGVEERGDLGGREMECRSDGGHSRRCGIGKGGFPELFMGLLPVGAFFNGEHEDVFHREEGDLGVEVGEGGVGVDGEMGNEVREEIEDGVRAEEGFGDGEAAVGGVVEGPFEPLGGGCVGAVLREGEDEAGDAADPLGVDGVPFVGHGGGADLVFAEGFFEFFFMGKEADVGGHFMGAGGERSESAEDGEVEFARVGLA